MRWFREIMHILRGSHMPSKSREPQAKIPLKYGYELPQLLIEKATVFEGEPSWPIEHIYSVVDWLTHNGYAVTKVELWYDEGGSPQWEAKTAYSESMNIEDGNWAKYTWDCSDKAKRFIGRYAYGGGLFNLTWVSESDETI
jgi:hypothetical protein